ncbi:MAG: hypothetical protein RBR53_05335 [Desulforegulaceae bacterium]|nr:hypothetical protein [Desulforegulaceae bacterium]
MNQDPASQIPANNFNFGFYIKDGFTMVKENPVPFLIGNLILMLINMLTMGVLVGHWYAGIYAMVNKLKKGETIEIGDAFAGFNDFIPNLAAGIVFSLCVGIASLFCIIPAFIVGGILFYLIPLVALRKETISNAIKISKNEAMKELVNHILFFLIVSVISFAGTILCGVGVFLTFPIGVAAMASVYEDRLGK